MNSILQGNSGNLINLFSCNLEPWTTAYLFVSKRSFKKVLVAENEAFDEVGNKVVVSDNPAFRINGSRIIECSVFSI